MKLIEIVISTTGETQLQTRGFVGSECRAASQKLEQALGLVTREQHTAEYHLATNQTPSRQHEL